MPDRIRHRPIEPFGFEVEATLPEALDPDSGDELRRLYQQDGLVLIRDLHLSMDEQLELCSVFGPVLRGSRENYFVSNVRPDGLLGTEEFLFHNDVPFVPAPYLGGSLHAVDVADGVSGTRYASGFRAFEQLPEGLRVRLDGLNALQVRRRAGTRRTRLSDLHPRDLTTVHSVVGRHAITGQPYLFVNEDMTATLIGMSERESDELLAELFSYLYGPGNVYEHTWRPGDIVIWDNLALQHARRAITATGRRTLQRVTIADIGFYDQSPVDLASFEKLRTFQPT
jgi:taurine dioxygenase